MCGLYYFWRKIILVMENFEETLLAWLRSSLTGDGHMETVVYRNSLLMVRITGTDFHLRGEWPSEPWHVFLQVHKGELRLTSNGERIGFDTPVYVDFLPSFNWEDVTLVGPYRVCFILVERSFFVEATVSMRNKITNGMIYFAQSPFTLLTEAERIRLQRLEDAMFTILQEEEDNLFVHELLQTMTCAWQYELWNIFFHKKDMTRASNMIHWNDVAAHFLYLAHTYCREQREVGWYAQQVGVSPDALSAALKRLYGKPTSTILTEMLLAEAKAYLRNSVFSVQNVAEILGFSDQSAFGKFFKRECGMSPSEYKKEIMER